MKTKPAALIALLLISAVASGCSEQSSPLGGLGSGKPAFGEEHPRGILEQEINFYKYLGTLDEAHWPKKFCYNRAFEIEDMSKAPLGQAITVIDSRKYVIANNPDDVAACEKNLEAAKRAFKEKAKSTDPELRQRQKDAVQNLHGYYSFGDEDPGTFTPEPRDIDRSAGITVETGHVMASNNYARTVLLEGRWYRVSAEVMFPDYS